MTIGHKPRFILLFFFNLNPIDAESIVPYYNEYHELSFIQIVKKIEEQRDNIILALQLSTHPTPLPTLPSFRKRCHLPDIPLHVAKFLFQLYNTRAVARN